MSLNVQSKPLHLACAPASGHFSAFAGHDRRLGLCRGLVALGPLGAIGGMLLGGNKKEVSFTAELDDGRKFMAVTDSKTWRKIAAALFEREGSDHKSKAP